jgi:restriction endonuclease Mrr
MADGVSGPQPQGAFREPILKVLGELGGRAPKREVLARLATTVPLTDADRQQNIRGERRWERRISSAAAEMRRDGILARTQHGVWALAGATGSDT